MCLGAWQTTHSRYSGNCKHALFPFYDASCLRTMQKKKICFGQSKFCLANESVLHLLQIIGSHGRNCFLSLMVNACFLTAEGRQSNGLFTTKIIGVNLGSVDYFKATPTERTKSVNKKPTASPGGKKSGFYNWFLAFEFTISFTKQMIILHFYSRFRQGSNIAFSIWWTHFLLRNSVGRFLWKWPRWKTSVIDPSFAFELDNLSHLSHCVQIAFFFYFYRELLTFLWAVY